MKVRDELQEMMDYETPYIPFMQLDGVTGYASIAQVLSLLLHKHATTEQEWVPFVLRETYKTLNISPYHAAQHIESLCETKYVDQRESETCMCEVSVQIGPLMSEVQTILND
mgnify:CR=1 FL=1